MIMTIIPLLRLKGNRYPEIFAFCYPPPAVKNGFIERKNAAKKGPGKENLDNLKVF